MQFEHISTQELESPSASISFQNIDTGFRLFRVTVWAEADTNHTPEILLNDDATTYESQFVDAANATETGARTTGAAAMKLANGDVIDAGTPYYTELVIGKGAAGVEGRLVGILAASDTSANIEAWVVSGDFVDTGALISRIDFNASAGSFIVGTRVILEGARVQNA